MDLKKELREKYEFLFGKKPFMGWTEAELEKAIGAEPEVPAEIPEEVVADIPAPTEDDRIAKLEAMVNKLAGENSDLREETSKMQDGWGEYESPVDANKTATVKIYRKDADSPRGVITSAKVFKNNAKNDENGKFDRLIYKITVLYEDKKEDNFKIDAMELAAIKEIEKVEIIKENSRTLRKVQDYVPQAAKTSDGYPKRMLSGGTGYGSSIGSGQVPLEVFMVKSTVTIKRSNGQEIEMENENLNL